MCYLKRFAPAPPSQMYAALCGVLETKANHIAAVADVKDVLVRCGSHWSVRAGLVLVGWIKALWG
jgi:hypothetical protein